ncbi:VWA domain-containing protein [bacterium]|nr:VWA domain-containing protein [bacterium]
MIEFDHLATLSAAAGPFPLALGFGAPWMLWGMAAGSIPVIIHLLNKRKFRQTDWAAMRFLLAAIKKNKRRIELEQWILLAIRTLLILLLVGAMARPVLESLAPAMFAGERSHRVLVLDGSMSMNRKIADLTRFERARTLARQIVKEARRGDVLSVILMGDPPKVIVGEPSPNLEQVSREIDLVSPTHGATDLLATFGSIRRVLESSPLPNKELLFLTDLQRATWARPGTENAAGLKAEADKLTAAGIRPVLIDLGTASEANVAVTDLRIETPVVLAGVPASVRAQLRNFGPEAKPGVLVRMIVDGQLGPERTVDLPVGESVSLDFTHVFREPGDHVVEIATDADPLAPDDRRSLVASVKDRIRILLVDGDLNPEPFAAETDYLAQALAPAESAQPGEAGAANDPGTVPPIALEVIPESRFGNVEMATYDVIVMANVSQPSDPEAVALDKYVRQGGGLVLFTGDRTVAEGWNSRLATPERMLLPATIGQSVGDAARKTGAFLIEPLAYRHPLVTDYEGAAPAVQSGLTQVATWQYHKLTRQADSEARVALAFDSGDPAIVEASRGRGRVFLVATSADSQWSTWPLHPSYPVVMGEMALLAASGRTGEKNLTVGQAIDQAYPTAAGAAPVTLRTPEKGVRELTLRPDADGSYLRLDPPETSGVFEAEIGPPVSRRDKFAVNVPVVESDPARIEPGALKEAVPGFDPVVIKSADELTKAAEEVARRGEIHRPMLLAVLVLILAETLMAWWMGRRVTRVSVS